MFQEKPEVIGQETAITWLEPLALDLPFVRENSDWLPRRTGRPSAGKLGGRILVAYAELRMDANRVAPGMFERRYWYLSKSDPYPSLFDSPIEGVRPGSVKAGAVSEAAYPALQTLQGNPEAAAALKTAVQRWKQYRRGR